MIKANSKIKLRKWDSYFEKLDCDREKLKLERSGFETKVTHSYQTMRAYTLWFRNSGGTSY